MVQYTPQVGNQKLKTNYPLEANDPCQRQTPCYGTFNYEREMRYDRVRRERVQVDT